MLRGRKGFASRNLSKFRVGSMRGFTLIELVIVIVILGILASIALPKFVDLISDAKKSASKAGLGAIRAVVALKYAKNLTTGNTGYPSTVDSTDFFDGKLPVNQLVGTGATGINITSATVGSVTTTSSIGWWYNTAGGQAGAYSDGAEDTSKW